MEMSKPPHPGEIIREDCLKPLKLSVTEAGPWRVAPVLVRTAQWPERDFCRHGAAPRKGGLEHGGNRGCAIS